MSALLKKLSVGCTLCGVIAGVWVLGALKAELDSPFEPSTHVDPAIVERALAASESAQPQVAATHWMPRGLYPFAG